MRLNSTITIIVAGVLGLASPAEAQIAPGQSGHSSLKTYSGQTATDTVTFFGRCFASRFPKHALQLSATTPGTRQEIEVYKQLFKGGQSCLHDTSRLNAPYDLIRGSVGEGLYHQRIPLPAAMRLTAPAAGAAANLSGAARCFVAAHEEKARLLVETTRPGSRAEAAMLDEIFPLFAECLPQQAANREFSSLLVRFRIGEAMYHLGMVRSPAKVAGQ